MSTEVYRKRPFSIRNADEYELFQILTLFVQPTDGLRGPFDFENSIVKGRMGSGKTMYLRANYAFHLYGVLQNLLSGNTDLILPIEIKLNDFQHLTDPHEIYRSVVIKIAEGICLVYQDLQDIEKLVRIHQGIQTLPESLFRDDKLSQNIRKLSQLKSDEYVERVETTMGFKGGLQPRFLELSANLEKNQLLEIKRKPNPSIQDVVSAHKTLLSEYNSKILLLIDEAGSLDKRFFRGNGDESLFEVLMNQLRTTSFIRTKIAIYPNSYQDTLTETRYGDIVSLEENILDSEGYITFRKKSIDLINNYLQVNDEDYDENLVFKIFEVNTEGDFGDGIEQILNASNGNMRRLIQLLDMSMDAAYKDHKGQGSITSSHVLSALKTNAKNVETLYTQPEIDFLSSISAACKSRNTYRFKFPNMTPVLGKYTSKSKEFNIINILELGGGRRPTTYYFDYCHSILHELPTHTIRGTDKINKSRTLLNGEWVSRTANISQDVLRQAAMPGKILGKFLWVRDDKGFILGEDSVEYFFDQRSIIEESAAKHKRPDTSVRFFPTKIGEYDAAFDVEILG